MSNGGLDLTGRTTTRDVVKAIRNKVLRGKDNGKDNGGEGDNGSDGKDGKGGKGGSGIDQGSIIGNGTSSNGEGSEGGKVYEVASVKVDASEPAAALVGYAVGAQAD